MFMEGPGTKIPLPCCPDCFMFALLNQNFNNGKINVVFGDNGFLCFLPEKINLLADGKARRLKKEMSLAWYLKTAHLKVTLTENLL